jgi:hypothetical protein
MREQKQRLERPGSLFGFKYNTVLLLASNFQTKMFSVLLRNLQRQAISNNTLTAYSPWLKKLPSKIFKILS